ncbi:MAG: DUF1073 domain-containing protein [Methanobrevibacter sp.]|nr:DUF1073 domain-containing protein [Methanobrevibacter sp.]
MAKKKEIQNAKEVQNSLSAVIASLGGYGLGTAFGSTQVSQVDTFFKNNRWYLISNIRQVLSEVYVEHGIVATLVDLPVDDGFRGGVEVTSDELDQEEAEDLNYRLERDGILRDFTQALKWARLFGGGALLIINDEDPATPFDVNKVKQGDEIKFKAVDMWELYYGQAKIRKGIWDPGEILKHPEYYNYYSHKIHHSRVLRFEGKEAPSLVRAKLRGWGVSVLETVVRSYNQYLKSVNLSFEVLDEFKVDYFKIDGFNQTLLTPDGSDKAVKRAQLVNMQKNYQHAVTMDVKDDFGTKQLNFSGIAEIMREIRMQIAADLRMPLTKLFGMSAAGFNSGEDDIENYNAMIETEIRSKSRPELLKVVEICCAMWYGYVPDVIRIEFAPLRVLSAEQEETIKTSKLGRVMTAMQTGVMTPLEAKQAINKEMLLPVAIKENDELLPPSTPMPKEENIQEVDVKANSKLSVFEKIKSIVKK